MKKYFLILDYNNIRYLDVQKIKEELKQRYKLSLCLIRPDPTELDFEIADIVLDLNFFDSEFVDSALRLIIEHDIDIVGGFPFSDKSLLKGTQLLKSLGVLTDDLSLTITALSKWEYRNMEHVHKKLFVAQNIFMPKFTIVHNFEEFKKVYKSTANGLIIKPTN